MIYLRNVTKVYKEKVPVKALNNVSLDFSRSGFVAVMGNSGAGKTTLLNVIGALDDVDAGKVVIDGELLNIFGEKALNQFRNKNIGFVFQNQALIEHLSVAENIELSMTIAGIDKEERKKRMLEALSVVGLDADQLPKMPNHLSGGEAQRVQIARAMVNNPKIILADEPTSSVDKDIKAQIMKLFKKLSKTRLVIMVTHSEETIAGVADRIITMHKGKVVNDILVDERGYHSPTPKPITKNVKFSEPNIEEEHFQAEHKPMPAKMALKLALGNLISKKVQTLIMSFAACIGIAGLALVMAISNGFSQGVSAIRDAELKMYPITISTSEYNREFEANNNTAYPQESSLTQNINVITEHFIENCINTLDANRVNFVLKQNKLDFHLVTATGYSADSFEFQPLPAQNIYTMYYDKVYGEYPADFNEIMLVVDENNNVSQELMYAYGVSGSVKEISFEELLASYMNNALGKLKVVPNNDYYEPLLGTFYPKDILEIYANYDNFNIELKVTGVLRAKPGNNPKLLVPGLAYTHDLYEYMQNIEKNSAVAVAQKAAFQTGDNCVIYKAAGAITAADKSAILKLLGADNGIYSVEIYVNSEADKAYVLNEIAAYNETLTEAERLYVADYASEGTATAEEIVSAVIVVLGIFALSALGVSSVLICVLMFNDIKERKREIGLLRSIGARRKDISRIFVTEVAFIGLLAGLIGVAVGGFLSVTVTYSFIELLSGYGQIAVMAGWHYPALAALSVVAAVIAGFVPAIMASRKTPIDAMKNK